jgi:GNAT superfamily N-acetyltransferase
VTVEVRSAETDAELAAWRTVRIAVLPNERTATVAEIRAQATPEQLLRDYRRHGIARALKQQTIHLASQLGLREVYTWTQTGNEAMQELNRSLGYVDRTVVATVRASLPLPG